GIAPDDQAALAAMAAGAAGADFFLTTGGASVGEHDLVREGLGSAGLSIDFWRIAMRPGKPLIFGHFNRVPMLGLPGNPVSALVCATIFPKPPLEALLGLLSADEPAASALLGQPLKRNDQRQDYLRARLSRDAEGRLVATPFDRQDSGLRHPG